MRLNYNTHATSVFKQVKYGRQVYKRYDSCNRRNYKINKVWPKPNAPGVRAFAARTNSIPPFGLRCTASLGCSILEKNSCAYSISMCLGEATDYEQLDATL